MTLVCDDNNFCGTEAGRSAPRPQGLWMYRQIDLDNAVEFFDPATGHRLHLDGPPSL